MNKAQKPLVNLQAFFAKILNRFAKLKHVFTAKHLVLNSDPQPGLGEKNMFLKEKDFCFLFYV